MILFELYTTKGLAWLTIAGTIIVGVFVLLWISTYVVKNLPIRDSIFSMVKKNSVLYSFIVALVAMLGSLFYSEIKGYEPCEMCWYQRIFMYPMVFLFGLALVRKRKDILPYGLLLSVIGAPIALYHYLMQNEVVEATSCGVVGYSPSCANYFILQYGYITIPMMALVAFALIISFILISMYYKKSA